MEIIFEMVGLCFMTFYTQKVIQLKARFLVGLIVNKTINNPI